ncbi:MAG: DUF1800 domain-containing protein [Xanthomonadales bacterium]|nr:DUF1800 domain-containing protein [Xanthomonadales bacterium]
MTAAEGGSAAPATPMRRPGKPPLLPAKSAAATSPAVAKTDIQPMATPPSLLRWLNRASFGATPALLAELQALPGDDASRWQHWIDQQLAPQAIADPEVEARLTPSAHPTLFKSLQQLWQDHIVANPAWQIRMRPANESEHGKLIRAVYSRRQLFEVVVDFWHDHFSTYAGHGEGGPVFPHYDRDVIRVHALGNFRQMLGEVARATTMMYFLDLRSNRRDGPNENFARELVELHTLGAEHYAGVLRPDDPSLPIGTDHDGNAVRLLYVDEDVYSATRAFTGWTIRNGHWQFPNENDGSYVFRPAWHDNYSKWFLNRFIQSYKGEDDGERVLDTLAAHPGTARHVCRKLCRRFVADEPPQSLVDSAAQVFGEHWQAPDQMARVIRHILLSTQFQQAFGDKSARPFQAIAHALRVLDADFTPQWDNSAAWTTSEQFTSYIQGTGHRPFHWAAPNGYPDHQNAWTSSGAMAMTWRMMAWLVGQRQISGDSASPYLADVVAQTQAAIVPAGRSANAIVDYWLQRLYGYPLAPAQRATLVDFMRQNAAADAPLDIDTEAWSNNNLSAWYSQSRLRYLVALMLCSPDFFRR